MSDKDRDEVATLPDDDENISLDFDDEDEFTDSEIRAGGARRTAENGDIFWLKLDHLREFIQMDRTIKEDADFWAWFSAAISTWGLKPIGKEFKKRGMLSGLWSGSSGSSSGWGWSGKNLSDYWGGSKWFGSKGSTEESRRLAIAVQAVQQTVRVIDNHERRLAVVLTTEEEEGRPSSYTSFDERTISVSPMALLDKEVDDGEGVDITTGFALHEAGHAEYTEAQMKVLRQPNLLRPATIAAVLNNVLEDVRTEGLTACDDDAKFPGFAGYLDKGRDYLWKLGEGKRPETWGPEIDKKVNASILGSKWYDQYKPLATDPELAEKIEWFHDWVEKYHTGGVGGRESLTAALAYLALDPETKKQMDEMTAKEKAWEKANGDAEANPELLKRLVKEMLKQFGIGATSCSSGESPGGGVADPSGKRKAGIGASERDEVRRMVKSEIESAHLKDLKLPDMGKANPLITVLRPPETARSQGQFQKADPSLIAKMRNVFAFRPSAIEEVDRLMRTGGIDEDELWRGGIGDYRMFEQKRIESVPDTSVTLLIDASGSMAGYTGGTSRDTKVQTALKLAQVMQACLKDMNGVRVRVRAHTGDNSEAGRGGVAIYRIWDQGDPLTRLSTVNEIDFSNNYDGYAIGWCIKEMVDQAKPNEQMVLIVLSDGYPAGSGYGGEPAHKHMRDTIAWGEKQGVDTIQIAIAGGMNQEEMFKHFVTFKSAELLPSQMTALLKKVFPYR